MLANEQTTNKQLRVTSEELAAELGGIKRSLQEHEAALGAERKTNAELLEQLESIKKEYIAAGVRGLLRVCVHHGPWRTMGSRGSVRVHSLAVGYDLRTGALPPWPDEAPTPMAC